MKCIFTLKKTHFDETSRDAGAQVCTDCKCDWFWVRSPLEEMKYLLKFIFSFFRSGVEAKAGTECLNTRFPLPTLLCARYSVKLIIFRYIIQGGRGSAPFTETAYRVKYSKPIPKEINQDASTVWT